MADKRQEIMAFAATWMDLQIVILSEVGQKEKDKYHRISLLSSVQLLSCVGLCDPVDCSTPGFPVHHQLLELAQTHVHRVGGMLLCGI